MFVITPKFYILKSSKNENDEIVKKMKDISFRVNNNIELESYKSYKLKSSNPVIGINRDFMVVESDPYSYIRHMVKYEQKKKAINSSALDKMIVLENHSCAPFLPNLTKED
jgi:trehalose-6-phosphate synthase